MAILEISGIQKYFPGVVALDGVEMTVRKGEVHALIGENGAGKSTLVKILTGIYRPDAGEVRLRGEPVIFRDPLESQASGISAIHQEAVMFNQLSVTENIFMGHHELGRMGLLAWKRMHKQAERLLDQLEISIDPRTKVCDLSVAERHMIEIAKALSMDAEVIIMDEPTSALSLREVKDLFRIIHHLREERKAVIFISHKFEEITEIADHFTVFRDGRYIGEGTVAETDLDEIVTMMVGRSLKQMFPKQEAKIGSSIMGVENLSSPGLFENISFDLHRGEILGFFGLVGAGRSEVMRALFGLDPAVTGRVVLEGREIRIRSPKQAMKAGLAYVPEDRHEQGTLVDMTIQENITLPLIDELSRHGFLDPKGELALTEEYGKKMEIKAASWTQKVMNLSGGNQQKVVLAKWLATNPRVLILDEPTKGIDVATKSSVHAFISNMAVQGHGIILVSSELPEVMGMADRIMVMYKGRMTGEFLRGKMSAEEIIKAAIGSQEEKAC